VSAVRPKAKIGKLERARTNSRSGAAGARASRTTRTAIHAPSSASSTNATTLGVTSSTPWLLSVRYTSSRKSATSGNQAHAPKAGIQRTSSAVRRSGSRRHASIRTSTCSASIAAPTCHDRRAKPGRFGGSRQSATAMNAAAATNPRLAT